MLFWHDLYSIIIWIGWYRCMISWMTLFTNTATYNSCYFDMNCMLLFFFLTLIDTRWWCSKWRIVPSYNSCHFHMNCIAMVTLIDELHCCEYYHIQLLLLWHELYFVIFFLMYESRILPFTTHVILTWIVLCGIRMFYIGSIFALSLWIVFIMGIFCMNHLKHATLLSNKNYWAEYSKWVSSWSFVWIVYTR